MAAFPVHVIGGNVAVRSSVDRLSGHGDLPTRCQRSGGDHCLLKGHHLYPVCSCQHFPCWYRLRGGQGIVEGNESICCLCLLVACSRCWHSLRLAERDRIKRPTRYLLLYGVRIRSEEHTSELQSLAYLVCRLLLEKKKKQR